MGETPTKKGSVRYLVIMRSGKNFLLLDETDLFSLKPPKQLFLPPHFLESVKLHVNIYKTKNN